MRILGICYRNTKCIGALLSDQTFEGSAGLTSLIPDPSWPPDLIGRIQGTHGPVELKSLDAIVIEWPSPESEPVDFKREQELFHGNVQAMFSINHVDHVYAIQRRKLHQMIASQASVQSNGFAPQRTEEYIDWFLQVHAAVPWDSRNERPENPALWSPPAREALFTAFFALLPTADIKVYNYKYFNPYLGESWSR